jgi:hypothetical protein
MDGEWLSFLLSLILYGLNFIEKGYSRKDSIKDKDHKMKKIEKKV